LYEALRNSENLQIPCEKTDWRGARDFLEAEGAAAHLKPLERGWRYGIMA
jgi:hypothetical protein